jgi:type II secretory pathway pseudopilin PulG
MSDITGIAQLLTATLTLLTSSKEGQKRKNLKLAKRTLRQLTRQFKKGGFTEQETELLNKLQLAIIEKTLEL